MEWIAYLKTKIKKLAISDYKYLIFVSINIIGLIGSAGLIIIETIMKYEKKGLLTMVAIFIGLIFTYIFIHKYRDKVDLITSAFLYPLNLILLPYLFVFGEGGGVASAMPTWFLFGILLNIFLLEGKNCFILLFFTCVMDIMAMYISYRYPALTNYSTNSFYYFEDNMICILVVATSVGLIFKYMKYIEKVQKSVLNENAEKIKVERNNAIKANIAKTTFITNISHDVRTPLTDILGMTSKAEANIENQEVVSECLKKIVNYSMELLYFFDNTLDLSEIESGALRIKENRFYVPDMVAFVDSTAKDRARLNKVNFKITLADDIDNFLVGDSAKVRQILLIILDNAIRYTRDGGKVELIIEKDSNRIDGMYWYRFNIKDDGVGMDHDFIDNGLFEPYVRGKEDYVRNTSGSGIGMAIAKKIVEAMGGTIKVRSEKNRGTEVIVDLPFRRDVLYGTSMEDKQFFKVKDVDVMIVDDDEISREIIEQMLNRLGVRVTSFRDAENAIEVLKSGYTRYKMVILDVVLPGMDGYSAARIIRNLDREDMASIPIIGITANAYSLAEEKAILSGMNEYISKPVDMTEFYQKMYRYLGKYSV